MAAALALPAAAGGDGDDEEEVPPAHEDEGGVPYEPEGEDVDVLYIATSDTIQDWNPLNQIQVIEHQFRQLVYEPLIRMSAEDYAPVPGLAEDWEVSEDGLEWTFHLQQDAVWHDGEPVTAEDVEYTFHIYANDERLAGGGVDSTIESVEAIDVHTVRFTLPAFDVGFERNMTMSSILPRHIWEEHEGEWTDWANDDLPIIGAGPFSMVDYQVDTYIRYERHEDYFRGPAGFEEIVYSYYTEPDTAVAALEAGYVDVVGGLNEAQIARLEGLDGIGANLAPDRRWTAIRFNTGSGHGDYHRAVEDAEVRRAIHHAIDRDVIVENVEDGHAEPATSIVPSVFSTIWWEPGDDERVDFDLEEANRILDEAGYAMAGDGVREDPEHGPLVFRIAVDPAAASTAHMTEYLTEWLREIGIELDVVFTEDSPMLFREGGAEMQVTNWGIQPNPISNLQRQSCEAVPEDPTEENTSDAFYCNPEYDELVEASQREQDEDARTEIYHEIQRILYHDAPMIFTHYPYVREAYNSVKIADVETQPSDSGMILGQQGSWAFHQASPTGETFGGASNAVLAGTAVVLVLGAAGVVLLLVRRRRTIDDRE